MTRADPTPVVLLGVLACMLPGCAHTTLPRRTADLTHLGREAEEADVRISAALEKDDIEEVRRSLESLLRAKKGLLGESSLAFAETLEKLAERFASAPVTSSEAGDIADTLLRDALAIRQGLLGARDVSVAGCLTALSDLAFKRGRWRDSEAYERRALEIREGVLGPEDPAVAENLRGLAILLFEQGRYREAEPFVDRARRILEQAGQPNDPNIVETLNVQAEILRVQGRFEEAESRFKQAIDDIARVEDNRDSLRAELRNNLAGLLKDQGRYAEAEAAFREVAAVWKDDTGTEPYLLSTSLLNQAEILRLQGRVAEAGPLYARALEKARRLFKPGDPQIVWFLTQNGVFHSEEGRYSEAEALYREALEVLRESLDPDHPLVAQTEHDLAGLLRSTDRFAEAEETYRRALAIREKRFGQDHPEVAVTLAQLARTLFLEGAERDSEALETAERALRILSVTPAFPDSRAEALAIKAELARRHGDLGGAISTMDDALRVVEDMRPRTGGTEASRAEFLVRYVRLFDLMVRWQVDSGNARRAVEYAERRRARVLLDQLAAARVDLRSSIPPEVLAPLAKREVEAGASLAEYQGRLESLRDRQDLSPEEQGDLREELERGLDAATREYQGVAAAIRGASPLWRDVLTAGGQTVTAATIQQELVPRRGLMLLYQIGATESFVFVLPPAPDPIQSMELRIDSSQSAALHVPAGPLGSSALQTALGGDEEATSGGTGGLGKVPLSSGRSYRATEKRLHALWRILVPRALWPRIQRASEVVLIPDGALHRLPFEALVVKPANHDGGARYWLDDGPVVRYAASATSLYTLGRTPVGETPSALIVANPTLERAGSDEGGGQNHAGGGGLSPLPGTAREAEAIRKVFLASGLKAVHVLEGDAAEEAAVRAALDEESRYLHFATHGLVDQQRHEMLAALALTPPLGGPRTLDNDGLLQLFEVYQLKLRASLAVLSACESAVGRRLEGEGVFALSRGFLAAGAQRVVASQWPVDDASTAFLMTEFYRRIIAAEASRAAVDYARALRDARLAVRRSPRWALPYFWAPFILTGIR